MVIPKSTKFDPAKTEFSPCKIEEIMWSGPDPKKSKECKVKLKTIKDLKGQLLLNRSDFARLLDKMNLKREADIYDKYIYAVIENEEIKGVLSSIQLRRAFHES